MNERRAQVGVRLFVVRLVRVVPTFMVGRPMINIGTTGTLPRLQCVEKLLSSDRELLDGFHPIAVVVVLIVL